MPKKRQARPKSPLTRKIDRLRHRLERGIRYALRHGFRIKPGSYLNEDCLCPIGAVIAMQNRCTTIDEAADTLEGLDAVPSGKGNNQRVGRLVGFTSDETEAFIGGFDGNGTDMVLEYTRATRMTPNLTAIYSLGKRLRAKYTWTPR